MSTFSAAAVAALAALAVAVPAAPAALAAPVTPTAPDAAVVQPSTGPTAGGTAIDVLSERFEFVQVSAGEHHTVALTRGGEVYAWGDNSLGQLGDGGTADSAVPAPVDTSGAMNGARIVQVDAGYSHTMALADDGRVFTWGYGFFGQLGDGARASSVDPVLVDTSGVPAGARISAIEAGPYTSTALDDSGVAYTWGNGLAGQLGTGTTAHATVPTAVVAAGSPIADIAAGYEHMVALTDDGRLLAWGGNDDGQLGTGGTARSLLPAPVEAEGALAGVEIVDVAAGWSHSLALADDGRAYAWGANHHGQLGDGTTDTRTVPVAVGAGTLDTVRLTGIAGGREHSLAVSAEGVPFAWGGNGFAQLGDDSTPNRSTPLPVDVPGGAIARISAGWEHSAALDVTGVPIVWGRGAEGQAGHGGVEETTPPVATVMPGLGLTVGGVAASGVSQVDAGTLRAVTPAHASGVVDLVVTIGGNARYPVTATTLAGAFTYGSAPVVERSPDSVESTAAGRVVLTAAGLGDEAPSARWQVWRDATRTWVDVTGAVDRSANRETGTSVSVTAPGPGGRDLYRVVFENPLGSATSRTAEVTVPATGGGPGIVVPRAPTVTVVDPPGSADGDRPLADGDLPVANGLADTGIGATGLVVLGLTALALLLIGGAFTVQDRQRSR